ncbi:MAG: HAD family hydrolase [Candidatus Thorarchaeota archaeon]
MIAFFDLEGPLCPIDHAAEVMELIGKKLGKEHDFYQLFNMISIYDDELFLVEKKKDYWPGDTLKLIAPIIISYANEKELLEISNKAIPTPGAKELFNFLHKKKIPTYIISTSYTQHAYTIAKKLKHPIENVRCTTLDFSLKPDNLDLLDELFDEIFPRYLKDGLTEVKNDLDNFFFKKIPQSNFEPVFSSTIVCGGGRKREAVIEILKQNNLTASEAIAIGDSITDTQMLDYVRKAKGIAVSFNGNQHSLKPANIAYSGKSIYPLKQLFTSYPNSKQWVTEKKDNEKEMEKKQEFFYMIEGITEEELQKIVILQKKYRKMLREKAAQLT